MSLSKAVISKAVISKAVASKAVTLSQACAGGGRKRRLAPVQPQHDGRPARAIAGRGGLRLNP
jgi:hypothetical protein